MVQASRRAGAKSCAVHHDGIAFHFAVSVQMRAKTSVEYWIVFEDGDCGFNCIERVTAGNEYLPSRGESFAAAVFAGFDGIVGNVPSAAMNNQ